MIWRSISRNALLLSGFAVLTTAIIVVTALTTESRIQANQRHAEESALLAIIPDDHHDNAMLDDFIIVDDQEKLGLRKPKKMYLARQEGRIVAVVVPVTARDGYTGDIDIIVGVNADGTVAGVRVLTHRETPGLGDKIDEKKSRWVDNFSGKSLRNPNQEQWKVKRDGGVFDQFTGATITPRAVTQAVLQALRYVEQNHALFEQEQEKPNGASPFT